MFIDDCEDCKIYTGPVENSIMMRTSKNCTFSTVTKQLRFRDCVNIKTFTLCITDPVVESSYNIFFAPYNISFPHLKELFIKAKFDPNNCKNHITSIYDFTPDKDMGNGAPHFLQLPDELFNLEEIPDGDGEIEEIYDGYLEQNNVVKENLNVSQRKCCRFF